MSLTGETPVDITAEPADGAGAQEHVAASLYAHHLFAARHMAELACELEKEDAGAGDDADVSGRHRTYVIGSVLLACAFLEASINEFRLEVQGHIVNQRIRHRE